MTEEIKSLKYMYRSRGLPDGYHHIMTFASCVLYQNGRRFDTKRIPFPYKTLPVLIRNATTACYTDPTPNPSPGKGGECLAPPTAGSSASYCRFVSLLLPVRARRTNGSRIDCARVQTSINKDDFIFSG